MSIRPEQESPREVPEADALEQQIPILPGSPDDAGVKNPLPDDAPEADVMEQRADTLPNAGSEGMAGVSEADAAEADLIDQALPSSFDDEEDYPRGLEENN